MATEALSINVAVLLKLNLGSMVGDAFLVSRSSNLLIGVTKVFFKVHVHICESGHIMLRYSCAKGIQSWSSPRQILPLKWGGVILTPFWNYIIIKPLWGRISAPAAICRNLRGHGGKILKTNPERSFVTPVYCQGI